MKLPAAPLALALCATAHAESTYSSSLYLQGSPEDDAVVSVETAPDYGQPGHWWWTVGGGAGSSLNKGDYAAAAFVGASNFLAEDFELSLDLTVWYLGEDDASGDDAVALNFNPKFRWHFIHEEKHTVFAEAGVGMLIASEEAPEGGSEFNFTPQAGVGATFDLSDGPERLIVGVNWRHISNANTFGSDKNPGRDDLFVYAGVTFPF